MIDEKQRVERIVHKLDLARERRLSCFGSQKHQFRLNPTADEAELLAFENQHGIQLPQDYRAFLKFGGNGGAGPYYGIYPLSECNDFEGWVRDEVETSSDFLNRPCPLHPDMAPDTDWMNRFECISPYQGTLSLGTMGCTYMMQLVVTGPYAGRVVYVDAEDSPPYMVREMDFLSWYERWLDELLGGCKSSWFGYGPGGGEDDFFRIVDDPHASDTYRSEAASAFRRLPSISDSTAKRIPNYLSHSIPGVRAGICATIRKFELRDSVDAVANLLQDSSPLVRREAVWTVMTFDAKRWAQAARQRLREDPDSDVASTAFYELNRNRLLVKSELIQLIEESPHGHIRSLAAHYATWKSTDRELLVRMLGDSESQVRFSATIGLRQLKVRDCLPAVRELLAREKDEHVINSIRYMLNELGG